jgi:hypothetical protein
MKRVGSPGRVVSGGAMTTASDQAHGSNNCVNSAEAAQRDKRFSEAVAKLRAVNEILSEIEEQYPEFWDLLRNLLRNDLDPAYRIPKGMDLETWAKQQGALPLEAFFDQMLEEIRSQK